MVPSNFFASALQMNLLPISWDRAEPGTSDLDTVLREIYVLYSDCALVSMSMMMVLRLCVYEFLLLTSLFLFIHTIT